MNITKLGLLLAVSILSSLPSFAQGGGRGQGDGRGQGQGQGQGRSQMTEEKVVERVGRLKEGLELTDEQHKTILAFEIEKFKEGTVERQKRSGDREAMREYMMTQREERNKKYEEVLSEEQLTKYKELQQQRKSQRPGQKPEGNSGERPSRGRG